MNWSSIDTSPFSVTVATRPSLCFSRRISTLRAAVDEPLGQLRVQRVRQPVFYRTGLVAPMVRVVDPGPAAAPRRSMCGYTPTASTTRRCRLRFGRCARSAAPASRSGCRRRRAGSGRAARRGSACSAERHLAEVRDLADVPEQPHVAARRAAGRACPASRRARAASRGRRPRGRAAGRAGRAAPRGSRSAPRRCAKSSRGVAPLQPARAARSGGSRSPRPPRGRAAPPRR